MASLRDLQNRRSAVQVYDPTGRVPQRPQPSAPRPQRPAAAPNNSYEQRRALLGLNAQGAPGEEDDPNVFGRGLGYVINNPLTRGMLKPLETLDYGRRAVTLGMEEFAEGITGQEFKAMEGDERSNMDKLKDPEYGVGQLLGDITGNKWADRAIGLAGDIAFDPISYVGGIGFATKSAAAGGKFARSANMQKVINQARRSGASDEAIDALTKRLAPVGRRGWAKADQEILDQAGVRGGIRMTTSPFSPYRGAQFTIPGSERLTRPLSSLRTGISEQVGKTRAGRAVQDIRVPNKLPAGVWDDVFRGGEGDLQESLSLIDHYQAAKTVGAKFAQPFVRYGDQLGHETRNLSQETKVAIVDALEDRTRAMPEEGKKFRELFDAAWKRAATPVDEGGFGLPLRFRKNYSPHILTRDAIDWRRNPANSGKVTAPTGFFTEAMYDPSGVTMARKFAVGDEFTVNGVPIKLEKATINEVNTKFREAGLKFDFFESDPGIIAQKYINMLSDDVGAYGGALDVAKRAGNRGPITVKPTTAAGTPIDQVGRITMPGGNTVQEGDLADFSRRAGLDEPLNENQWMVVLDKDATKDVNLARRLKAARDTKAARAAITETRDRMAALLTQAANGTVTYPGAPSLKAMIRERNIAAKNLGQEVTEANDLVKTFSVEKDAVLDRIAWHSGVVRELEQEILPIDILLREIRNSAPREMVSALDAERRILVEMFEKATKIGEEARERIALRGSPSRQALEAQLDQRTEALYRSVGLEPPTRSTMPTTGPRVTPGVGTVAVGHRAVEIERKIAANMESGVGYKGHMAELVKLTGRTEDDIIADLARRGVVAKTPKPSGTPSRANVNKAVAQARTEVADEAKQVLDTFDGPLISAEKVPTVEQIKAHNAAKNSSRKMNMGDWDAINAEYQKLLATPEGRKVYRTLKNKKIITDRTAFQPDDWSATAGFGSVDEAVVAYFNAAKRFAGAQPRQPISREVAERAATRLGIENVDLVRAARRPETWEGAVADLAEGAVTTRSSLVSEVSEVLGEEGQQIAAMVRTLDPNDPNLREAVLGEIEMAFERRGLSMNDYSELYEVDAEDILSGLETGSRPRTRIEDPVDPQVSPQAQATSPQAVDNPVLGPQPPERVPSSQLAGDYDAVSNLRAQRQALINETNSVSGLEGRVRNTTATRDKLMREIGYTSDRVPNMMGAQAAVDRFNQALANQAQELALAGDIDGAQALTARMFPNGEALLDEYDRLTKLIGDTQDEITRIKTAGPERRAQIADLDKRIEQESTYIRGRVSELPKDRAARAANQQDEVLDRLIGREQAGKQAQLEQVPTQGEVRLPNVAPSGARLVNIDWAQRGFPIGSDQITDAVHDVGRRSYVVPRDTNKYKALLHSRNVFKTRLTNIKKKIDLRRKMVRDDPRVAEARLRAETAMGEAGGVRRGQIILPERPGQAPKNLKDFPNWDAATDFWTKQVDDLIESTPIKGSPDWAMPNRRQKMSEYERIQKEVGEEYGIPALMDEYKEVLLKEADVNNQLGRRIYEADDPASVAALSKTVRESFDQGELSSIARERQAIPDTMRKQAAANTQDKALIDRVAARQQDLAPRIEELNEPMKEILSNPQAREALSREALDQPEAQRALSVKARKEAEKNASASIAAVAKAQLPKATDDLARAQIDLATIAAGHMDAAKLAGEAKGWLASLSKLNPKNRGTLKVEEFMRAILDADPQLRSIDNQAIVYNIMKAEELADEIPKLLAAVETAKLSAKGEHLSRAVDVVLQPTYEMMFPEMGALGPIISKDLSKRLQNVKRITNDNKFWRHVDNMTGLFKTYATLTPGFHMRNALSAAFMNASDGVPLTDSVRAARVMTQYGGKNKEGQKAVLDWLEDQKKVILNKETGTSMADALDAVSATGVGGRYREHGVGDRTMAFNRANERAYSNWMTYYIGKRPGTFVESSVRLPVAIDTLRRGGTIEDAVNRVTRLHFDYSEVSNFDQTMRRLIPFWTFMSRNFPLQIAQMYTNPRAYAKYNSFIRNFRGEPEENEPEYFSKIGAFRLMDTEIRGMPVYLQPDLPHARLEEEMEKVSDLLTWENPLRALTDFNPMLTAPAEFATKQDFYTGQRFDDRSYRPTGILEKPLQMLGQLTNQTKTGASGTVLTSDAFLNAARAVNPLYDRSVRLAPQATTGANDQNAVNRQVESFLRFLGAPVRQLSPQQQQSAAMGRYYDQRDVASNERWLANQ